MTVGQGLGLALLAIFVSWLCYEFYSFEKRLLACAGCGKLVALEFDGGWIAIGDEIFCSVKCAPAQSKGATYFEGGQN